MNKQAPNQEELKKKLAEEVRREQQTMSKQAPNLDQKELKKKAKCKQSETPESKAEAKAEAKAKAKARIKAAIEEESKAIEWKALQRWLEVKDAFGLEDAQKVTNYYFKRCASKDYLCFFGDRMRRLSNVRGEGVNSIGRRFQEFRPGETLNETCDYFMLTWEALATAPDRNDILGHAIRTLDRYLYDNAKRGGTVDVDEYAEVIKDVRESTEIGVDLQDALDGLTEKQRDVMLFISQGESLTDIAKRMDVSVESIRHLRDKARKNLQKALTEKAA
jgi:hypothetical protein